MIYLLFGDFTKTYNSITYILQIVYCNIGFLKVCDVNALVAYILLY